MGSFGAVCDVGAAVVLRCPLCGVQLLVRLALVGDSERTASAGRPRGVAMLDG